MRTARLAAIPDVPTGLSDDTFRNWQIRYMAP